MKTPTIDQLLARDADFETQMRQFVAPGRRIPGEFRREVASYMVELEQKAAGLSGERSRSRLTSVAEKWRNNLQLAAPDAQSGPPRRTSFEFHISRMLSEVDVRHMKSSREGGVVPAEFAIDLKSYEDVKKHAEDILDRLQAVRSRLMPPQPVGPWPPEWIALFKRWIAEGCPQ